MQLDCYTSRYKPVVFLLATLFFNCVSSIPVYRSAENIEKGSLRSSSNAAMEIDIYSAEYLGSSGSRIQVSGMGSYLIEYGFSKKLNLGANVFLSIGEGGATLNLHYQLNETHAPLLHCAGLYTGYILSGLRHNFGNTIVLAPEYMVDLNNGLFFGLRYIHRFVLHPDTVWFDGAYSQAPPYQITLETIFGYRKGNALLPLVIGYNPVYNWWQVWFGITAFKIYTFGRK